MIRFRAPGLLLVLGCLAAGLGGCDALVVEIDGGAVELRWEIRNADGDRMSCGEAQVHRVHFTATPLFEGGTVHEDEWSCGEYEGVTRFEVPPGRYALAIRAVCPDATEEPKARVPAPITRDISNGNVAELHTLLIEKLPDEGVICVSR
jgi:hypothetical protein